MNIMDGSRAVELKKVLGIFYAKEKSNVQWFYVCMFWWCPGLSICEISWTSSLRHSADYIIFICITHTYFFGGKQLFRFQFNLIHSRVSFMPKKLSSNKWPVSIFFFLHIFFFYFFYFYSNANKIEMVSDSVGDNIVVQNQTFDVYWILN